MRYTPEALAQIDRLADFYEERGRASAIRRLDQALIAAERSIVSAPGRGLAAPRPYPGLARPGRLWIKANSYWIAYRPDDPPTIVGVFYDRSDIPGQV